ncbi:hypothetical protein ACFO4N_12750 [Camelliibacillus cellulosilyticus]|uniref:YtxH-like protein n=1 Tax=Camelliibacillus cellulosilyticus TaxID=2174486 RepID=A0ABV9GMZ5_9BACL
MAKWHVASMVAGAGIGALAMSLIQNRGNNRMVRMASQFFNNDESSRRNR